MLRTGVLMPRSTLYPSLGIDILNGIKSFLHQHGIFAEFTLLTENIGFGIDDQEIYSKAEKLLLQDDADLVIAIADSRATEMLSPLFAASNKLLLVVNFGANFPESWRAYPATIVHSLNFCLHARLTGKLAAGKKAAYVLSYFDAGYKQCYSLMNSHQQNGGEPCLTHVTDFKPEAFNLQSLADVLEKDAEIKTLLCLFTGDTAALFYEAVAPLQKKYGLTIFASPMLLEASVKDFATAPLQVANARGYTPWINEVENEANSVFKSAFEKTTGKKANIFGMLGWETGLLLQQWLEQYKTGERKVETIKSTLVGINLDSPRGWLKLDPGTHHTYGSAWLVRCEGNMLLSIEKECDDTEKEWSEFTREPYPGGESSSWKNTYLCI